MKSIFKKLILLSSLFVTICGCGEASIFPNIPLTINPLVLANPIALAASPLNNLLFIVNSNNRVNWFDSSFVVMDITNPISPVAIAVISIPNFSGQMILDEARGFVYIPNRQSASNSDTQDQVLSINIDQASPEFLQTQLIPAAPNPFGASYEDPFLFVAAVSDALQYNVDNFSGYSVVDLNVTTNEDEEINVSQTRELAISPSGQNIFVTNSSGNMLILNRDEFLPPDGSPILELGTEPVDYVVTGSNSTLGIATDSQFIYVVEDAPSSLKIFTDADLTPVIGNPIQISSGSLQVGNIPLGVSPSEVIVDEPTQRAYVSNTGSDDVSVIDLVAGQEIARIPVDTTPGIDQEDEGLDDQDQPFALTLVELGGVQYLYVANFQSSTIFIINTGTLAVEGFFPN